MREGICQVAPAARSPDAGIEPASGEAGWKAGAPRESRRSQEKLGPPAFQPARGLGRAHTRPKHTAKPDPTKNHTKNKHTLYIDPQTNKT
jgi:hypothetical protein